MDKKNTNEKVDQNVNFDSNIEKQLEEHKEKVIREKISKSDKLKKSHTQDTDFSETTYSKNQILNNKRVELESEIKSLTNKVSKNDHIINELSQANANNKITAIEREIHELERMKKQSSTEYEDRAKNANKLIDEEIEHEKIRRSKLLENLKREQQKREEKLRIEIDLLNEELEKNKKENLAKIEYENKKRELKIAQAQTRNELISEQVKFASSKIDDEIKKLEEKIILTESKAAIQADNEIARRITLADTTKNNSDKNKKKWSDKIENHMLPQETPEFKINSKMGTINSGINMKKDVKKHISKKFGASIYKKLDKALNKTTYKDPKKYKNNLYLYSIFNEFEEIRKNTGSIVTIEDIIKYAAVIQGKLISANEAKYMKMEFMASMLCKGGAPFSNGVIKRENRKYKYVENKTNPKSKLSNIEMWDVISKVIITKLKLGTSIELCYGFIISSLDKNVIRLLYGTEFFNI